MTTFEQAGKRAGAVVDSGVRAARQRAKVARKNAKRARKELAKRVPDHTASMTRSVQAARHNAQAALTERAGQAQEVLSQHLGPTVQALADRWDVAQDVLAEWLLNARHELAARIEPEPPAPSPRKRWPWVALLLGMAAGVAGAAVLARRPQEIEPEPFPYPGPEADTPASAEEARWGGVGNGAVGVERPSAGTD